MNVETTSSNCREKICDTNVTEVKKIDEKVSFGKKIDIFEYLKVENREKEEGKLEISPRENGDEVKSRNRIKKMISRSSFRDLFSLTGGGVKSPKSKEEEKLAAPLSSPRHSFDEDAAIFDCISQLINLEAYKTEGIGRISGSAVKVEELMERYKTGERDVAKSSSSKADIVTLLKRLIVNRREKLIPEELQEKFFALSHNDVAGIKTSIDAIPSSSKAVLERVIFLLSTIAKNSDTTKMTATNCATCFAPNFLDATPPENCYNSEKKRNELHLARIDHINALFTTVIENYEDLFIPPIP